MSEAWNEYWSGAANPAAADAVRGCAPGAGLSQFWRARFSALFEDGAPRRLVDLAGGGGAVAREAALAAHERGAPIEIVCLDVSPAAAASAADAVEAPASAVVGDAARLPLALRAFDVVTSQYGVEYAGRTAVEEAGRLVAPGGACIVLAHLDGGAIQAECRANAAVLSALVESGLFAKAQALFDALARPDAVGSVEDQAYRAALQICAEAASAYSGPAADHAARLSQDIATLLQRRAAYHPRDAAAWLDGQAAAAAAYLERMRDMVRAALSKADVDAVAAEWTKAGLRVAKVEPISMERGGSPCAWRLEARGPGA